MSGHTTLGDMPGGSDPDIQRLWAMSLGEFAEIEADATHPLHEKALVVGRAMMAPFAEAIRAQSAGLGREISRSFGRWAVAALSATVPAGLKGPAGEEEPTEGAGDPTRVRRTATDTLTVSGDVVGTLPALTAAATGTLVDFSRDDPPDVTVAQVHDAAQEAVIRILSAAVEVQEAQLEHLRAEAEKSDTRLAEERRRTAERDAREERLERKMDGRNIDNYREARSSARGSWTATVVGVLGILVAIVISVWPKH